MDRLGDLVEKWWRLRRESEDRWIAHEECRAKGLTWEGQVEVLCDQDEPLYDCQRELAENLGDSAYLYRGQVLIADRSFTILAPELVLLPIRGDE